jgi:YD repeat-containing protein
MLKKSFLIVFLVLVPFILFSEILENSSNLLYNSKLEGSGIFAAPKGTVNPGKYLANKAPKQVTPGIKELTGQYIDDLGKVQPWKAHYDQYGRLIGRTDFNAGNITQGIPDIHYHLYEWGAGKTPLEIGSHIPGEF